MAKKKQYFEGAKKTEQGLEYNGFILSPVIDKCDGCERAVWFEDEQFCTSYPNPERKWAHGACNFATHVKASVGKGGQVKVNPIKASKRAARGK
ncbi:MAG: PxxKW family cysteine-rich protein [Thermodesulfobacteriota bacterium]